MTQAQSDNQLAADLQTVVNAYIEPHLGVSLEQAEALESLNVEGDAVSIRVRLPFPAQQYAAKLKAELAGYCVQLPGVGAVRIDVDWAVASNSVQGELNTLPGIKNIIAVASGKGGVGKSTVAANLALALVAEGASVGMLDADIYGPSQPNLFGTVPTAPPTMPAGGKFVPTESLGVKVMSMGYLVEPGTAMIWRGPMVTQALHQLLHQTEWAKAGEELDYLIVDLPPGTGDVHLTLAQKIPVSGAVIVTTPQELALIDARKGIGMFNKVQVRVLGVVENMSGFDCPNCGHHSDVFDQGGGVALASENDVRLLGNIPLSADVRAQADSGKPTVAAAPDSDTAQRYTDIALNVAAQLAVSGKAAMPTIEMVD